jgi:glycosyltransferase involved in cell wall biosynthesis
MQDFPLVSLVVFGFNQERFIDDAIAGALAQDYPQLEIILSDDCSADGTYTRMVEAASKYAGPHRIRTARAMSNAGTLAHVYRTAQMATGELLVLAAGDDISQPHRVMTMAKRWQATGAQALFSKYDIINETGETLVRDYQFDHSWLPYRAYFPDMIVTPIHGASSAYARRTLLDIPCPDHPIVFEDTFFTLMLSAADKSIQYVDEPLVQYRRHDASITNSGAPTGDLAAIMVREQTAQRRAAQFGAVLEYFRESIEIQPPVNRVDHTPLDCDIAFYRYRASWLDASFMTRVSKLFEIRRSLDRRWALGRIMGLRLYFYIRVLANMMRFKGLS